MGPNSTRTRSRTRKATRSSNKVLIKKTKQTLLCTTNNRTHQKQVLQNSPPKSSSNNNNNIDDDEFPKTEGIVFEAIDDIDNNVVTSSPIQNGCSTPKGDKFRIPEIENCPPAPKKRRLEPPSCSVRRSPIAFFAPPDLELFFYFALRGISV